MRKTIFLWMLSCTLVVNAAGDSRLGAQKSMVCAACHGVKGVSLNPVWPSLAGQHPGYLVKQLKNFKEGHTRDAIIMGPLVQGLSLQDMEDLAAFYAAAPLPKGLTPKQYVKRGEALYRGGDFNKHITACIACHGPDGMGNGEAGFPVLSGQQAEYTRLQLWQFKDKKRKNDLNSIMQDISARMDAEDMNAVAHYVAGLTSAK